MSRIQGWPALLAALVAVTGLALVPRLSEGLKRPRGAQASDGWYSIDPDGLYHTRRVERVFQEGLPVAERDPFLDFPQGARIPWPPYYDTLLYACLRPFAPRDVELRRPYLERAVASLPVAFGVLTALAAALAAWSLADAAASSWRRAGLAGFAGVYAVSGWGSINYSRIGTGDHHAWVGLLHVTALLVFTRAFAGKGLRSARVGLAWGALSGLLAGLMLGSWVASLLYVVLAQLLMGWLLVRRSREELPGVATFGLAYHLVALAVLTPAVLSSPWKQELPWMVVNLSWFHLTWLAAGALVFVPPLLVGRTRLAAGRAAARAYPFAVAAALAGAAGLLWLIQAAPARGVAEGFAWVSRADAFMDSVRESAPLIGSRAAPDELFLALGYGVLLVPLAWGAAAWKGLKGRSDALMPWVVIAPVVLVQALAQKRFSDAALAPVAVLLAWGAGRLSARLPAAALLPAGLVLATLAHLPSARLAGRTLLGPRRAELGGRNDAPLGERETIEWLRDHTPTSGDFCVLAHWDRGHVIEWAAERPSVATNFGSYVGIDSYRDPARFFLTDDVRVARGILTARAARYVFAPVSLPDYSASMARIAGLPEGRFLGVGPAGGQVPTELFRRTLGAQLVFNGRPALEGDQDSLDFLRLVHVSARVNPAYVDSATGRARPAAFLWEHVTGAELSCSAEPGARLEVEIDVFYPTAPYALRWRRVAVADASGTAHLRVPYATTARNGDGEVQRAVWRVGGAEGQLAIPEDAVQSGASIVLP